MGFPSWKYNASTAGIVYIHLALWGSLITFILALYLFAVGASDQVLVPCAVLLIIATSASFAYVFFHEYNARKRKMLVRTEEAYSAARKPVYVAARLLIALAMLWLLSSGWNMIIAARQPICRRSQPMLSLWQIEGTCKAQRAGAAFSILNLLIACALFSHMVTTRDPYGTHLLGRVRDRPSTVTPYRFSATFRLSKGKQGLVLKRRDSNESIWAAKPLPKTPNSTRPPTPAVDVPDPLSLGILSAINLAASPPKTQAPRNSQIRPNSSHTPSKPSNLRVNRTPSTNQSHRQSKGASTLLSIPPIEDFPQPPTTTTPVKRDPSQRSLNPPKTRLRHLSSAPLSSHPYVPQEPAPVKRSVSKPPRLDLDASRNSDIRSGSAYPYARNHSRNKSAPFPPMVPPKSPTSHGPPSAAPRKRGHVRCTSDPNEMISAHLAAEMDLAMRLEFKLHEVSQKVESQRLAGTSMTTRRASEGGETGIEKEMNLGTGVRKSRSEVEMKDRLYARMEWDMLMGKEVGTLN